MFDKKTILTGLLVISVSMPVLAKPNGDYDLVLHNNTKLPQTSVINHAACSDFLGDIGITKPGKSNTIPAWQVAAACFLNTEDCVADVYMTDHCGSHGEKPVAIVHFDTTKGIKSDKTVILDAAYQITGTGFDLTIKGGPALASK